MWNIWNLVIWGIYTKAWTYIANYLPKKTARTPNKNFDEFPLEHSTKIPLVNSTNICKITNIGRYHCMRVIRRCGPV